MCVVFVHWLAYKRPMKGQKDCHLLLGEGNVMKVSTSRF